MLFPHTEIDEARRNSRHNAGRYVFEYHCDLVTFVVNNDLCISETGNRLVKLEWIKVEGSNQEWLETPVLMTVDRLSLLV